MEAACPVSPRAEIRPSYCIHPGSMQRWRHGSTGLFVQAEEERRESLGRVSATKHWP